MGLRKVTRIWLQYLTGHVYGQLLYQPLQHEMSMGSQNIIFPE